MWRWLLLAGIVIVLDQASKHAAVAALAGQPPVEVTSFFNLLLVYNRGAAFSFLAGAGGWQRELFTLIALAASVWIVWLLGGLFALLAVAVLHAALRSASAPAAVPTHPR